MKNSRRKARTIALQVLYEIDTVGHDSDSVLKTRLTGEELSDENADFTRDLVNNVLAHKIKIDGYIKQFAPTWPLEQISAIDRNILRLAIFEILLDNKTPVKVAIDEAVELSKTFGSDNSSKFVNGVLGSISTLAVRNNSES
jgi:N utilization substance protein B